ncbi:MAG: hypothetical protein BWY76_03395 [bacterium ADurb.Bin429]|nr:MAG: hypothetical protein BWY76_03395 [bacterium ADurb.Bin429]
MGAYPVQQIIASRLRVLLISRLYIRRRQRRQVKESVELCRPLLVLVMRPRPGDVPTADLKIPHPQMAKAQFPRHRVVRHLARRVGQRVPLQSPCVQQAPAMFNNSLSGRCGQHDEILLSVTTRYERIFLQPGVTGLQSCSSHSHPTNRHDEVPVTTPGTPRKTNDRKTCYRRIDRCRKGYTS